MTQDDSPSIMKRKNPIGKKRGEPEGLSHIGEVPPFCRKRSKNQGDRAKRGGRGEN